MLLRWRRRRQATREKSRGLGAPCAAARSSPVPSYYSNPRPARPRRVKNGQRVRLCVEHELVQRNLREETDTLRTTIRPGMDHGSARGGPLAPCPSPQKAAAGT